MYSQMSVLEREHHYNVCVVAKFKSQMDRLLTAETHCWDHTITTKLLAKVATYVVPLMDRKHSSSSQNELQSSCLVESILVRGDWKSQLCNNI